MIFRTVIVDIPKDYFILRQKSNLEYNLSGYFNILYPSDIFNRVHNLQTEARNIYTPAYNYLNATKLVSIDQSVKENNEILKDLRPYLPYDNSYELIQLSNSVVNLQDLSENSKRSYLKLHYPFIYEAIKDKCINFITPSTFGTNCEATEEYREFQNKNIYAIINSCLNDHYYKWKYINKKYEDVKLFPIFTYNTIHSKNSMNPILSGGDRGLAASISSSGYIYQFGEEIRTKKENYFSFVILAMYDIKNSIPKDLKTNAKINKFIESAVKDFLSIKDKVIINNNFIIPTEKWKVRHIPLAKSLTLLAHSFCPFGEWYESNITILSKPIFRKAELLGATSNDPDSPEDIRDATNIGVYTSNHEFNDIEDDNIGSSITTVTAFDSATIPDKLLLTNFDGLKNISIPNEIVTSNFREFLDFVDSSSRLPRLDNVFIENANLLYDNNQNDRIRILNFKSINKNTKTLFNKTYFKNIINKIKVFNKEKEYKGIPTVFTYRYDYLNNKAEVENYLKFIFKIIETAYNCNMSLSSQIACISLKEMDGYYKECYNLINGNPVLFTPMEITTRSKSEYRYKTDSDNESYRRTGNIACCSEVSFSVIDEVDLKKKLKLIKAFMSDSILFVGLVDKKSEERFRKFAKEKSIFCESLIPDIVKTGKSSLSSMEEYKKDIINLLNNRCKFDGISKPKEWNIPENLLTSINSLDIIDFYNSYKNTKLYSSFSSIPEIELTNIKKEFKVKASQKFKDMIGLKEIKSTINKLVSSFAVQNIIAKKELLGLDETPSKHMIFYGNPGTAKTTVAKYFTEIMFDNKIIPYNKFVLCGRNDLVGEYVGETAGKTMNKIKEAKGGVLFIDEAYSLVERKGLYGDECINTLVQAMDEVRKDTIIIFAGYPDKMREFLDKNEGLRSRIAFHINFPNYSVDELVQIMELMCKNKHLNYDNDFKEKAIQQINKHIKDKDFGNGRFIRNLIEQSYINMTYRLMQKYGTAEDIPDKELNLIIGSDCVEVNILNNKTKRSIGFGC